MKSIRELEDEIATLASHIDAAMARWLALLVEYDERSGWADTGCKTLADWLSFRCGVAPFTAREYIRVAYRLTELPLVSAAFDNGELSYSKVRALCRLEDIDREAEVLDKARHMTAGQLESVVRGYRSVLAAEQGAKRAFDERRVSWWWDDDGSLVIEGRLPADQGALLVKALEAARDDLGPPPPPPEEVVSAETPARLKAEGVKQRNADALTALAGASLAARGASSTADRYQVVVHVDAEALAESERADDAAAAGRCQLDNDLQLARQVARRLSCDCSLVGLVEQDGNPLWVGRKTRAISPQMDRALRARDNGCVFPGCTQKRHVDGHHIRHWADGGATDLPNLCQLCRFHHGLVHEGGYTIKRKGSAFTFFNPNGEPLPHAPRRPRGDCAELLGSNEQAGTVVSAETGYPLSGGERMHLGLEVENMSDFCRKRRE